MTPKGKENAPTRKENARGEEASPSFTRYLRPGHRQMTKAQKASGKGKRCAAKNVGRKGQQEHLPPLLPPHPGSGTAIHNNRSMREAPPRARFPKSCSGRQSRESRCSQLIDLGTPRQISPEPALFAIDVTEDIPLRQSTECTGVGRVVERRAKRGSVSSVCYFEGTYTSARDYCLPSPKARHTRYYRHSIHTADYISAT